MGLVDVQGRDRRLQHVGIAAAERQRALERGPSLRDLVEVPERSILIAEEDHRAVGESRVALGRLEDERRDEERTPSPGIVPGVSEFQASSRSPRPPCPTPTATRWPGYSPTRQ